MAALGLDSWRVETRLDLARRGVGGVLAVHPVGRARQGGQGGLLDGHPPEAVEGDLRAGVAAGDGDLGRGTGGEVGFLVGVGGRRLGEGSLLGDAGQPAQEVEAVARFQPRSVPAGAGQAGVLVDVGVDGSQQGRAVVRVLGRIPESGTARPRADALGVRTWCSGRRAAYRPCAGGRGSSRRWRR